MALAITSLHSLLVLSFPQFSFTGNCKPQDSLYVQVINYMVILNRLVNVLLRAVHVGYLDNASLFPNITSFVHYNWNDISHASSGCEYLSVNKMMFMYDYHIKSLQMLINGSSRISYILSHPTPGSHVAVTDRQWFGLWPGDVLIQINVMHCLATVMPTSNKYLLTWTTCMQTVSLTYMFKDSLHICTCSF